MDTEQAVIVFYIAIWVGVSAVATMVGKRGALSWVAAVAWTAPAAWLTLIGAWILPDRSVYEPAASAAPSELWPVHLALAVWVGARWRNSNGTVTLVKPADLPT